MYSNFLFFSLVALPCMSVKILNVTRWRGSTNSSEAKAQGIDGIYRIAEENQIHEYEQLYKKNSEVASKWISSENWTFHRDDIKDPEMASFENINLVLDGIDTTGNVFFRYQPLGPVNNMFSQYIFDIKNLYREEYNDLQIELYPPTSEASQLYDIHTALHKLIPDCPPDSYKGDCHVFMIRKMQGSFGSVVGPSIPSMGVWKQVYIEGYNDTLIRHVVTHLESTEDDWLLTVDVYFAGNRRNHTNGTVAIKIATNELAEDISLDPNENGEMVYTTVLNISKNGEYNLPFIKNWWPNEYGEQKLYDLDVTFTSASGNEVSSKSVRIGFRTVELVEEELVNQTSFHFKVNNQSIFIKGAILLPLSLQPELGQDREKIYQLLSQAKDRHMNMIRIWGGGVYESDALYEIADELGLLVWQDFMFTDYSYPADDEDFISSVVSEVSYQLKRIYGHPSAVVFCGNDEGELAIAENRYSVPNADKDYYNKNYFTLQNAIKSEFLRLTKNKGIYLSSTPSNGIHEKNQTIADDPNSVRYGDAHIFNYDKDPFDTSSYAIPRFCSSYGIQSIPAPESFLRDTFDNMTDLEMDGDFMLSRQHYPGGFEAMKKLIEQQLELPGTDDSQKFYETFVYYSQIIQAYSMRRQTELYRSYRNYTTAEGVEHTMGTIYYHFNDVWTAPAWSGTDFFGKWKMLQYYVTDFFNPIIITGILETKNNVTSVNVYVVSDVHDIVKQSRTNATIQVCRWDGLGAVNETTQRVVVVGAGTSQLIHTIDNLDDYLDDSGCNRQDCFIYLKLETFSEDVFKPNNFTAPDNFLLLAKLKESNLNRPLIKLSMKKLPYEEIYEITITTDKNALFVWLDAHRIDGRFSENGFLQTQATKKVFFYSDVATTAAELEEVLTVTHVRDEKYS